MSWFNTKRRREYINITPEVERAVAKSKASEGMALVSAMHITAGVYVNDAEEGLIQDIEELLQKLAPEGPDYRHPPNRRDERRCAFKKHARPSPNDRPDHLGQARLRHLAADLLCRVQAARGRAGDHQGHRRVRTVESTGRSERTSAI